MQVAADLVAVALALLLLGTALGLLAGRPEPVRLVTGAGVDPARVRAVAAVEVVVALALLGGTRAPELGVAGAVLALFLGLAAADFRRRARLPVVAPAAFAVAAVVALVLRAATL
ncbi:hypothetical protein [Nocardioides sp. SYSU D00038]|uniref:hypothetical protein n=1 Tax=Nocardioides sp. SYSU D00038 TaxID=2812554 RepID=UPI00196705DC|nr:hypothetical protein [Nocardioides sp. SYSU D00038]